MEDIKESTNRREIETNSIIDIKQQKESKLNTCIYVDYENIIKQLNNYNVNPIESNFFEKTKRYLENQGLNIIDYISYSNYDCDIFNRDSQTRLQGIGLQTRHTSNKGKNSGDLEMTIDALRTLYKNGNIDVFVIMSCDRDFIPLIKAIKAENKIAYVISTKIGFNKIVATYADRHVYIEDLFIELISMQHDKTLSEAAEDDTQNGESVIETNAVTNQAKELCKYLFKFGHWQKYLNGGEYVSVKGFIASLIKNKNIGYHKNQINNLLEVANDLEYIKLEKNEEGEVIIKENIGIENLKND